MAACVIRWDGPPATRGQVEQRLRADNAQLSAWGNEPHYSYDWHEHEYRDVVWCVAGSITFHTHDGDHELQPGDRIELDPGTLHAASVGPAGVECLEVQGSYFPGRVRMRRRGGGAVPERDERPAEQRHEGPTYADTKAKQDEFEELLREEESDEEADEDDFQVAVERHVSGDAPEEPPPSSSMP